MLDAYRRWVRRNAPLVSGAEGLLQGAVWLLPDRFSDSELKCEALSAGLGLLSLFNACVLDTPGGRDGETQTGHARGLPLLISAIQQVEVLLEIAANQWSSAIPGRNKHDVLCVLELIKLVLRVKTLHDHGGRLLLDGACSSSGYASGSAEESKRTNEDHNQVLLESFRRFRDQRTSATVPAPPSTLQSNGQDSPTAAHPSGAEMTQCSGGCKSDEDGRREAHADRDCEVRKDFWWDAVLQGACSLKQTTDPAETTCPGRDGPAVLPSARWLLAGTRGQGQGCWRPRAARELMVLGELLHLSRPMIYCLLLRRYGRRSWRPWFVSLVLDLASSRCLSLTPHVSNPWTGEQHLQQFRSPAYARSLRSVVWSSAELQERQRRRVALLFYLLRSPAFESVTRPVLMKLQRMTSWLPLFGFVTEKTVDILVGIQPYYTYTAAS